MITIVPLGPGDPKYLTEESQHTLLTASNLVLRTSRHPVRSFLEAHAVPFTSLDDLYDEAEDFDELNQAIVHHLLKLSGQENLVYAVSDPQTDVSVRLLRSRKAMNIRVLPGVPLSNWYLSALPAGFSCTAHLMTGAALDLVPSRTDCDLLLTELHTRELAGLVKLQLADLYPDEYQVVLFSDFSSHASLEAQVIPLFDLDRQKHYDHLSALYVPALPFDEKVQHTPEIMRYTVHDLMDVTSTLRSPDGCPWDREQTHQSLRPYLLEEAYEAAGAIDENDMEHLCDELGDVLLQIAFHATIAQACGDFNLTDIATAICRKMIRRHPRIFAHSCDTEASDTWDAVKRQERGFETAQEALLDVSPALPSLTRTIKVQKRAASAGFALHDFADLSHVLARVHEAADAVQEAVDKGLVPDSQLGDLLFSCVSAARLKSLDPEELLRQTTEKFIRRFSLLENRVLSNGKSLKALTLQEMVVYWTAVKQEDKNRLA